MSVVVSNKDEIIMQLVHYFVTEEDYEPILVNGVKNEVWLENLDAPYKVIRINSNYIHNEEQYKFDIFKIKNIVKQIKKKTFSLKMKTMNILLDLNDDIKINPDKNIDVYNVKTIKDVRNTIGEVFPKLKTAGLNKENDIDMIVNITNDINEKTEEHNKEYEKIFKPKKNFVTNAIIALNIVMYILCVIYPDLVKMFILDGNAVKAGKVYLLLTSTFLHASILHLGFNMYALYVIGNQVETFIGKTKFLIIYLVSGITASMLSALLTQGYSLGASGAIFGLMGCLLYFGYHYRLYLGSVLLSQIVPVILLNLFLGFSFSGIDNAAHIGGLIGGLFISMALGLSKKDDTSSRVNGWIIFIIYFAFLSYLLFLGLIVK